MPEPVNFPEDKVRKTFIELSLKRRLLKDATAKLEEQSKRNMELQQTLDATRQELEVAQRQIGILQKTCEKLQSVNVETTVSEKVAHEAKQREAAVLRQDNLQLQMEKLKLERQANENKNRISILTEAEEKMKTKLEEINAKIALIKEEQEKLSKNHLQVMEKRSALEEQAKNTKTVVDYYKMTTDQVNSENVKLMEHNNLLSNEMDSLKATVVQPGLELRAEESYKLVHTQNSLKIKENELQFEIENKMKLQSALNKTIERSKELYREKFELEAQLKKLSERVEFALSASKESRDEGTQTVVDEPVAVL